MNGFTVHTCWLLLWSLYFALLACDTPNQTPMKHDPSTDPNLPEHVRELANIAYRYHPRWQQRKEHLHDYMERIPFAPETLAREDLTADKITDNRVWHEFLADVKAALPHHWVADARAPGVDIPSYQLIVGYEPTLGSGRVRHLVFRLSFLAPVYDFYESDQDPVTRKITRWLIPTPESSGIFEKVSEIIPRHFEHTLLDPRVGAIIMPGIGIDLLSPGEVTLASMLFQEKRNW